MERVGENYSFFQHQFPDRPQQNWYETEEEEVSCSSMNEEDVWERLMKEVDVKGHEMINKLLSKVENNVPFEQEFRETWHHLRQRPAASRILEKVARKMGREREGGVVMRERGGVGVVIDGGVLQGELKNERFKVKNMNVVGSGVVKEEGRERERQLLASYRNGNT